MPTPEQPPPDPLAALVAVSLLRAGLDTIAARSAKELISEYSGPGLVREVAGRLWSRETDRQRHVSRAVADSARALAAAALRGIQVLAWPEPAYPDLLRTIPDPPPVLWVLGQASALLEPAVGIVGSRDATPTSLAVARTLARQLAEAGLTVVSGLARGVDGAAHAGALEGGGRTVAVLGSGLDVVYPSQHTRLAEDIVARGALISELPPGMLPFPRHFPLRNRIISGLSRAVVVVEASERSGSLITARMALEQGRDVLAVPGGTLSGRHRGCHALIKDGARLVETVEDVLEEIGWSGPEFQVAGAANHLQLSDLEATMAEGEAYSVDDLARNLGRSAPELLPELGLLELSGRVTRLAGGHFMRLAGWR